MYIDTDKKGQIAIHDLTPLQAFVISMMAKTHANNIESFYSKDELSFLQSLSYSIDTEIFAKS